MEHCWIVYKKWIGLYLGYMIGLYLGYIRDIFGLYDLSSETCFVTCLPISPDDCRMSSVWRTEPNTLLLKTLFWITSRGASAKCMPQAGKGIQPGEFGVLNRRPHCLPSILLHLGKDLVCKGSANKNHGGSDWQTSGSQAGI